MLEILQTEINHCLLLVEAKKVSWQKVFLQSSVLYSGEGDGTPLQYSCLENPLEGGAC